MILNIKQNFKESILLTKSEIEKIIWRKRFEKVIERMMDSYSVVVRDMKKTGTTKIDLLIPHLDMLKSAQNKFNSLLEDYSHTSLSMSKQNSNILYINICLDYESIWECSLVKHEVYLKLSPPSFEDMLNGEVLHDCAISYSSKNFSSKNSIVPENFPNFLSLSKKSNPANYFSSLSDNKFFANKIDINKNDISKPFVKKLNKKHGS